MGGVDVSRHRVEGPRMRELSKQCESLDSTSKSHLDEGTSVRGHGGLRDQDEPQTVPAVRFDLVGGGEQQLWVLWLQSYLVGVALFGKEKQWQDAPA